MVWVGKVRVDVVWFGEQPKNLDLIYSFLDKTDIFLSIGTSNNVYPAAGFIDYINRTNKKQNFMNLILKKQIKAIVYKIFIGPASKTLKQFVNNLFKWQGRRDSNSRPTVLETVALPTELHPYGAGEGNRTLVTSLEGWGFTTKLHPH